MRTWLGIDPGPTHSAIVAWLAPTGDIVMADHMENAELRTYFLSYGKDCFDHSLAIEDVEHRGLAVGRDTFETLKWIGRFTELGLRAGFDQVTQIRPATIRAALCGTVQVSEREIRTSLMGVWGGEEKAIGGMKCPKCKGKGWFGAGRPECPVCHGMKWRIPPGLLQPIQNHSMRKHLWRALAVAVAAEGVEAVKGYGY